MFKSLKLLFVGIFIGILVAPAKGSATRKKILNALSEGEEEMEDAVDDAANGIKYKMDEIQEDL